MVFVLYRNLKDVNWVGSLPSFFSLQVCESWLTWLRHNFVKQHFRGNVRFWLTSVVLITHLIQDFVFLKLVHVFEFAHHNGAELEHFVFLQHLGLFEDPLQLFRHIILFLLYFQDGVDKFLLELIESAFSFLVVPKLPIHYVPDFHSFKFLIVHGFLKFTSCEWKGFCKFFLVRLQSYNLLLSLNACVDHDCFETVAELFSVLQLDSHHFIRLIDLVDSLVHFLALLVHCLQCV